MARPVRGEVLSLREKEFVEAARAQGAGPFRIMFSELLPNLASTVIVFFTLLVANAILLESALSFLGAGRPAANPSWGTMIHEGVDRIATAPHLAIVPGPGAGADRAGAERVRRRRAGRTRPAREGQPGAVAVARFVVRRLVQMVFVMFAVSVLTFFIFNIIPNGDPAERMAGRQPREAQNEAIRKEWGFDDNVFVQYWTMMKKVFSGDLVSYFTQLPVGEEIVKGLPRTLSLAIGAAILWMAVAICWASYSAMRAGKFADRFLTIVALIGISMPVFWLGALTSYYLGYKAIFPNGGYVDLTKIRCSGRTT